MKQKSEYKSAVIRVSFDESCYRSIAVSLDAKLTELAETILYSFDFDNDHLYAFFMSNEFWDSSSEYTIFPEDKSVKDAALTSLSELELEKGRLFKFLFDFGDEWKFQCCVTDMTNDKYTSAAVIEKYGKSPEQYPDYDEDDDWDDDDDEYCGEMSLEEMEKCRKSNDELLKIFRESLSKFTPKTIRNHVENADFYINDFLLERMGRPVEEGAEELSEFFGYFFIRKCMWSTPGTIKSTAASIKKFYKCMAENGKIEKEVSDDICEIIKENMEEWQDECADYNDGDWDPFGFY